MFSRPSVPETRVLRNECSNRAVVLVEEEELAARSFSEAEVHSQRWLLALFPVLGLNKLEERLRLTAINQQHSADGLLSAGGGVGRRAHGRSPRWACLRITRDSSAVGSRCAGRPQGR